MVCNWPGCGAERSINLRGRPSKHCAAHKGHPRAPARTECAKCKGPIGRERVGHGQPLYCLACRSQILAERRRTNIKRFRKENPARWRAIARRARLKAEAAIPPAPESTCQDCGQPTSRGPYAVRCHPCKRRHNKLRQHYGIGSADYNRILSEQGGLCAICRGEPNGHGELHVDHCHATGQVRGLLCANCNLGIGNLRDSAAIVLAAHVYLTR